jgi:hypothetical protein
MTAALDAGEMRQLEAICRKLADPERTPRTSSETAASELSA